MDCAFEWAAHAPIARKAGVRDAAVQGIRDRRAPDALTPEEAQVVGYVTQLLGKHRVAKGRFARSRAAWVSRDWSS